MVRINFYGQHDVTVVCDRYSSNDRLAVFIEENKEPFATVSVNLPNEPMERDEFVVKSYSENQGLFDALLAEGVIGFTGRCSASMNLPICCLCGPAPGA